MINEILKMSVGCRLGGEATNILCYADDIILLSPSATGLQIMIDKLAVLIEDLCLSINLEKSIHIIFTFGNLYKVTGPKVSLNGINLERVQKFKYLGVFFHEDLSITGDVDRATNAFLAQFHSLYSKFSFVDRELMFYLFRTYTSSFYGIESWWYKMTAASINKIAVAYHKAVKKVAGLNVWDSNHVACEIVNVPIFKHLLARRIVTFLSGLYKSSNICVKRFSYHFRFNSYTFSIVNNMFLKQYGFDKVFENPMCAVNSRIYFVQHND